MKLAKVILVSAASTAFYCSSVADAAEAKGLKGILGKGYKSTDLVESWVEGELIDVDEKGLGEVTVQCPEEKGILLGCYSSIYNPFGNKLEPAGSLFTEVTVDGDTCTSVAKDKYGRETVEGGWNTYHFVNYVCAKFSDSLDGKLTIENIEGESNKGQALAKCPEGTVATSCFGEVIDSHARVSGIMMFEEEKGCAVQANATDAEIKATARCMKHDDLEITPILSSNHREMRLPGGGGLHSGYFYRDDLPEVGDLYTSSQCLSYGTGEYQGLGVCDIHEHGAECVNLFIPSEGKLGIVSTQTKNFKFAKKNVTNSK